MLSVNTNYGAMVALQNLNKTNSDLSTVQSRINTGFKVAGARDDGGTYAIAQRMRSDVQAYGSVQNSLDRSRSVVDTAIAAGEAVSDLLVEMKAKALAAADTSLDAESRSALNADFVALRDQIANIVSNAEFNGINLVDGSTVEVAALANADGDDTITVSGADLSLGGSVVSVASNGTVATASDADTMISTIETSLNQLNNALARMGTGSKALEIHNSFLQKLSDELEKGIGNLVDADLARESARLQSLQVKQQLGTQALSIANQSPQSVLGLFR